MKYIIYLITFILLMAMASAATQIATDNFECNGFNCGTGWLGAWSYTGTCEITTLTSPIGVYQMRGVSGCNALRTIDNTNYQKVNVSFYATATSLEAGDTCAYYYYNGTHNRLLFTINDVQDTGVQTKYNFQVTSLGLKNGAGIRMKLNGTTGDYCYMDNITFYGVVANSLNIFTNKNYISGSANVSIDLSSSVTNTMHTFQMKLPNNTTFCAKNITSPSVAFTSFSTICNIPTGTYINASAKLLLTATPTVYSTKKFNIVNWQNNVSMLKINKVYYSPQVLQGGSTQIFALLEKSKSINVTVITVTLTFPDSTTRTFYMQPTGNIGEYSALITDTFQVGNIGFTINIQGGIYYTQYSGNYVIAKYNVDFVDTVNKVAICQRVEQVDNVTSVNSVDKIPMREVKVFGTEYRQGEKATVFLQLKDDQGLPVNTGNCYINIYNPDAAHTAYLNKAPMLYLTESDGLYYYDIATLPSVYGVYMMTATCSYAFDGFDCYYTDGTDVYAPTRTITTGTYTGDPIALNSYADGVFTSCTAVSVGVRRCNATYTFNASIHGSSLINVTNINMYYMGESTLVTRINFSVWNWSSSRWIKLPNNLVYSGGTPAGGPYGLGNFISNAIPSKNTIGTGANKGLIKIWANGYGAGTVYTQWDNWLSLHLLTNSGTIQDLKGSSEIHINDWFQNYTTLISESVWTRASRNLTYYAAAITDNKAIAKSVWNYTTRNLTYYAPVSLNAANRTAIAIAIWTNTYRNLTYTGYNNLVAKQVWNYTARNLTSVGNILVAKNVWNYTIRNLTYYLSAASNGNQIAKQVWNYTARNLTAIGNKLLAKNVWNYTTRNLTYYLITTIDNKVIAKNVWNYTSRNMTSIGNLLMAKNVWNFTSRNLTSVGNKLIAKNIWNYTIRNLTYYSSITTLNSANLTAISNAIWTRTIRNLTGYGLASLNSANLTAISNSVWTRVNRNLTYYATTTINNTAIAAAVWNYNITGKPAATSIVFNVWNYVARYIHGEIA
jgi:hypothetical protein